MSDRFIRTEMILGKDAMEKLKAARVAVFGVGGVGGYAVEALARSGIGTIDLIDHDTVALSNINRQIIALEKDIGRPKVEVFRERIAEISPDTAVNTYQTFYLPENAGMFDFAQYDYIIDAIDTVTAKIDLIITAQKYNVPIISSMGCGNRTDPLKLTVTDIYKTSGDPLAKIMRRELKKRGVRHLKVVYSTEAPAKPDINEKELEESGRRSIPGSTAFVPPAAGLIIASQVVKDIISRDK